MTANWNNNCARPAWAPGIVLAVASAWLFSLSPVQAQLGATPEEMVKLYGAVFRRNARIRHRQIYESSTIDGDIYKKDNFCIRAAYRQGKVVLLEFCKIDDALKQSEVDALLAASSGRSQWVTGKDSTLEAKFYHREDGKAVAQWATGYDGSLLVSAEEPERFGDQLLP